MVAKQGHGRFLSYLLVNKALQCKIDDPNILSKYLFVTFDNKEESTYSANEI